MTTLRQFTCDDLFRFNPVNLDPLTETYGVQFYLQYLARWPEYFLVAESPSNEIMGMVYQWIFNATNYHHTTYYDLWFHHKPAKDSAGCLPQTEWLMKICIFRGTKNFSSNYNAFISLPRKAAPKKFVKWRHVKITNVTLQRPQVCYWYLQSLDSTFHNHIWK